MNAYRLLRVLPNAPFVWLEAMIAETPYWGIDTPHELASFVAQLAHESAQFTCLEENLNYSAQRLVAVWPRRFPTLAAAQPYARAPEKLANLVYANRIGNGDAASGDGWRFRGRGPIQLTGRNNYATCGKGIQAPLLDYPELLLQPRWGVRAACWYWKSRGLDLLDDDADVAPETKRVNGGTHGLAVRQAYFDDILAALQQDEPLEQTAGG